MATITITTNATHDARIAAAFGQHLNLGRNANAAEIKAELVRYAIGIVKGEERSNAVNAAAAGVSLVSIT